MDSGRMRRVARGARPDATDNRRHWFLLKAVTRLRLTYQIRLLTFGAQESRVRLIIRVPRACVLSEPLHDFLKQHKPHVTVEWMR
jgi:hypothetical protein